MCATGRVRGGGGCLACGDGETAAYDGALCSPFLLTHYVAGLPDLLGT